MKIRGRRGGVSDILVGLYWYLLDSVSRHEITWLTPPIILDWSPLYKPLHHHTLIHIKLGQPPSKLAMFNPDFTWWMSCEICDNHGWVQLAGQTHDLASFLKTSRMSIDHHHQLLISHIIHRFPTILAQCRFHFCVSVITLSFTICCFHCPWSVACDGIFHVYPDFTILVYSRICNKHWDFQDLSVMFAARNISNSYSRIINNSLSK